MDLGNILTALGILVGAAASYVASMKTMAGGIRRNEESIHSLWKSCERFERRLEAHEAMVTQIAVLANNLEWFRKAIEEVNERLRRANINGNHRKTED